MYIDGERSWLMHQADHFNRTAGGVVSGDVVGVYLNLSAGTLTFYVNGMMQVSCLVSFYYYIPFYGTVLIIFKDIWKVWKFHVQLSFCGLTLAHSTFFFCFSSSSSIVYVFYNRPLFSTAVFTFQLILVMYDITIDYIPEALIL